MIFSLEKLGLQVHHVHPFPPSARPVIYSIHQITRLKVILLVLERELNSEEYRLNVQLFFNFSDS